MFGDPHFWERALMWVTGQDEERSAEKRKREEEEESEASRLDRGDGRLPKETFTDRARKYGDLDRSNIEDRRAPPSPQGWPNGWEHTYDPRWRVKGGLPGQLRSDVPPDVLQGIDEETEFTTLRDDNTLIDDRFEPTDSALVLRRRNPNGTITYVHALTGQPLFEDGLYGMNDPQGAEPGDPDPYDPYWRAGRREW